MARHRWDNKLSKEVQTVQCVKCGLYKERHYPMRYMYYYDPNDQVEGNYSPRYAPECRGYKIIIHDKL